jgi:hypothetical protein
VIGIVYRQGPQLHGGLGEVHRSAQQELELRREMHVGVNPAARIETKADRLGTAVRAAEKDLALEGDSLGLARFPRQLARIDYVLP